MRFETMSDLRVTGDIRLLKAALHNLLGNAWKFTRQVDDANVQFGASLRGEETVYYVRDNGVGFDVNYAGKLFTPFQRLHSRAEYEGSGIGLATVQRIIHRHGGRIWADGSPGNGAAFLFTLGEVQA